MPTLTSSLCPACGTPNPPHSLFCEKCGTRLIASLNEEPEGPESAVPVIVVPKGLSLPTKPASTPEPVTAAALTESEEELPDWMQVVQSGGTTAELDRAQPATPDQPVSGAEEIPTWLAGLDTGSNPPIEEQKPDTGEVLPEWTQRLRTLPETEQSAVAEEDEVPDWLKVLGSTGRLPSDEMPLASGESTPLVPEEKPARLFKAPPFAEPPTAETEELPEWLKEHPQFEEPAAAELSPLPPGVAAKPAADEMPDWLRDLGPAAPMTDEALPDWLDELGAEEEPASPSMALSTGDSALDWLSQLSATAPEAQPAESVAPDWMSSLRTAAPEIDSQPAEEVPAWMSVTSGVETPEATDWMSSFRSAEPAAEAEPEEGAPDWLTGFGVAAIGAAAIDADQAEAEAEPAPQLKPVTDWLTSLRRATPETEEEQAQAKAEAAEVPEWVRESGAAPGAVGGPQPYAQEIPDWARESGVSEPSATAQPEPEEEGVPDWLTGLGVAAVGAAAIGATQAGPKAEPVPQVKPATDWLSSLRQATPEMEEEPAEAETAEVPQWLRESEAGTGELPTAAQVPEEEGVPDWLQGLGTVAAGAAVVDAVQGKPEPESKPATDWLAGLRQATPELEAEQAQEEEALPEWLREPGTAPQAIGGPQAHEEEVPEWLRESGTSEVPTPTAQAEEEGVPDWLQGLGMAAAGATVVGAVQGEPEPEPKPETDWLASLRQATPEMEAEQAQEEEALPEWLRESGTAPQATGGPQAYEEEVPEWLRESGTSESPDIAAQAEEEGVPDWLKGFGAAAAGAAAMGVLQGEPAPESKPATDWLSSLRQAAPEMEAEQAAEKEEAEIPEWLHETGAAPQAIGGQQAYEQEVPEWLREESGVSEPQSTTESESEAGVPDWLQGLGVATAGAAAVAAVSRGAEPTAETEMPDWLREAEPTPAITFETPTETIEQGEVPEWLRDLTPAAAVAGTAAIAQPGPEETVEEPEPPEEIEEIEPEPETADEGSGIAKAALAGAAAAAALGAVKGSKAEAAPASAEMPSWLKELRQEQETAQTTIQVPPAEAAGLTQAEIPAWLEALRPQGQPLTPLGAETPSEAEGPLAGIANALPPAPLMGQVQGAPMKLQFETSAEDLARAGVLKELLGQPTAAPASLEQFVVKSSAIRRRSLRWTMAALIIFVLMLPGALSLNGLLTSMAGEKVEILPNVQTMYVPAAVTSMAVQIKALPESAKVLVVFDYDATQSGEMKHIAQALLKGLATRSAQIEIASLNPQGVSLAQQVLKDFPEIQQLPSLGYAPGQANGVQDVLVRMGDAKLVVELAASADTVRWWAEQMKTSHVNIPLVVGISAGAETLTVPYLQSKQITGMVSGLPGALAFLKGTTLINAYPPDVQRDYQVALDGVSLANYTLAVLIIIGLIAALFGGKRKGTRS
jgi:hypothetical protein